jgi:pSer/pThr/pTyr-binding forkhead associated (FHA) protein
MALIFKIISGPLQGRQYPLEVGMVIGRSDTDISIDDAKMSGRHAKIGTDSQGKLIIVDLGSTNGLKVNNKTEVQVELTTGLIVKIGNTSFQVVSSDQAAESSEDLIATVVGPMPPPLKAKPQAPKKALDGFTFLSEFVEKALPRIKNNPKTLTPIQPLLVFTFIRGVQTGTEWTMGYGPREVGIDSIDFPLFDGKAPSIAFSVIPKDSSVFFSTEHSQIVFLNGRSVSSDVLKDGDEISFNENLIRVKYIE